MMYLYVVFAAFVVMCSASNQTETELQRIIFAVDTSASMEISKANFKIKQSIATWLKYFATPKLTVGIVELKQDGDYVMKNLSEPTAIAELMQILSKPAYGAPCLQCGLQTAAKMLGDTASNKDEVVVMMEERSAVSPHDTPQYSLDLLQPSFRISTIALTENADEDLEQLAHATVGQSDFVRSVTAARLLRSYSLLPAQRPHIIVLPKMKSLIDYDDEIKFVWDEDVQCWVAENESPPRIDWYVNATFSDSDSSILATLRTGTPYQNLVCHTDVGLQLVDATVADIKVSAYVVGVTDPMEYWIKALVESEDGSAELVDLYPQVDLFTHRACVPPSAIAGRHSVVCYASRVNETAPIYTKQSSSFKVHRWPDVWPVDDKACNTGEFDDTESTDSNESIPVANENIPVANESIPVANGSFPETNGSFPETNGSFPVANDSSIAVANESVPETNDGVPLFKIGNKSLNETQLPEHSSPDNVTDVATSQPPLTQAHTAQFQITLFVVGIISIIEVVVIIHHCKARRVVYDQESNRLIPYNVDS